MKNEMNQKALSDNKIKMLSDNENEVNEQILLSNKLSLTNYVSTTQNYNKRSIVHLLHFEHQFFFHQRIT